jgi:hypothetical protein
VITIPKSKRASYSFCPTDFVVKKTGHLFSLELDSTLELHGATGTVITKNNNWKETQLSQIAATQIAPTQ